MVYSSFIVMSIIPLTAAAFVDMFVVPGGHVVHPKTWYVSTYITLFFLPPVGVVIHIPQYLAVKAIPQIGRKVLYCGIKLMTENLADSS